MRAADKEDVVASDGPEVMDGASATPCGALGQPASDLDTSDVEFCIFLVQQLADLSCEDASDHPYHGASLDDLETLCRVASTDEEIIRTTECLGGLYDARFDACLVASEDICMENADCGDGRSCLSGACWELGTEGQDCEITSGPDHGDCAIGLFCDVGGVCVPCTSEGAPEDRCLQQ